MKTQGIYLLAARARPPEHVPDPAPTVGCGADPNDEEGPAPGDVEPPIDEDLMRLFTLSHQLLSKFLRLIKVGILILVASSYSSS